MSNFNTQPILKSSNKPAIALITYARSDYFEEVFNSIINQKINGKIFSEYFDFYVFQDGLLKGDTVDHIKGHQSIQMICENKIPRENFIQQDKNLCVALHFDYIERLFFETQNREWAAFFEDDLVLSPGYLETLMHMAESFKDDDRVAMFNCFGMSSNESIEVQELHHKSLTFMDHHWGFGIFQKSWRKRQVFVDEYLKMVNKIPYRKRNHKRINNWLTYSGFNPLATSQDYIKACSISALNMVKISSFANFGTYIGKNGLHFTSEIFNRLGYDKNVTFTRPIKEPFTLDEVTYKKILTSQKDKTIKSPSDFCQMEFENKLIGNLLSPERADLLFNNTNQITESDVISGYKIILGRLPESDQIIHQWIGQSTAEFLKVLISSNEFLSRKQFNNAILILAKKIIDSN
jgi:hypothetical protein